MALEGRRRPVSDGDGYILERIRTWVWSGFYTPEEVQEMLGDLLEEEGDVDARKLRAAVGPELAKKAAAEATWPEVTDCDRLDAVFAKLAASGLIAIQNAGYTISDGISDVSEQLSERDSSTVRGYCFYHGQDLERAVAGHGLMLAFADLDGDADKKRAVGALVAAAFREAGFEVDWNGDPENRIDLPKIDWKRRLRR
jgi:hypothetical protein